MPKIEDEKFLDRHLESVAQDIIWLEASSFLRQETGDGLPDAINRHIRQHPRHVIYQAKLQDRGTVFIKALQNRVVEIKEGTIKHITQQR